jgi:WXG100 family type VII secretion target
MPMIHVEPEDLQQTARDMWQHSLAMEEALHSLQASSYRLEMAWQGSTADEYAAEFRQLLHQARIKLESLDQLGILLSHQADLWHESDQRWEGEYRSVSGE